MLNQVNFWSKKTMTKTHTVFFLNLNRDRRRRVHEQPYLMNILEQFSAFQGV